MGQGMMSDGMMLGMGLGHWLIIVLVVLAIAALVKYLFFHLSGSKSWPGADLAHRPAIEDFEPPASRYTLAGLRFSA